MIYTPYSGYINVGGGEDTILSYQVNNSEMIGGEDDDYILGTGELNGGAGNDTISTNSDSATIVSGAGNDLISLTGSRHLLKYGTNYGKDTVYGYNNSDSLQIAGGYSTAVSGNNVIISVGSGSITLVNAKNFRINISPVEGCADTTPADGDESTVLLAGSGGSTLLGGKADDKLFGGAGVDLFAYTLGNGKDVLNSVEAQDIVSIDGASLDQFTFKDSKAAVTIDLGDPKYFSAVKEINASTYGGAIHLIGNAQANILKAGTGNSTLDGSYNSTTKKSTADKLYGGSGSDIFVWNTSLGGSDQIFNYDCAQGDIISITGDTITKSNFKEQRHNHVRFAPERHCIQRSQQKDRAQYYRSLHRHDRCIGLCDERRHSQRGVRYRRSRLDRQ